MAIPAARFKAAVGPSNGRIALSCPGFLAIVAAVEETET
jgi:hypothetical protein